MINKTLYSIPTFLIATVWFINGLYCKVLQGVPRHEQIVERILGEAFFPAQLTKAIGIAEILMALWILSGIKKRWCALAQMIIIATMNTLEFILAPDLLLWGKYNSVFAASFILLIYVNEFHWRKNLIQKSEHANLS